MIKKLQHVDALRGVAILLVLLVHTGQRPETAPAFQTAARFGQFGVQLFFVVSAFTLCHSARGLDQIGIRGYGAFMVRRFFRIAPLYYLAIPFYFLVSTLWLRRFGVTPFQPLNDYTWPAIAANILFLHGLFRAGNNTIVWGGWSVGCEFLFYAIFPFLFVTVSRRHLWLWLALLLSGLAALGVPLLTSRFGFRWTGGDDSFEYFSILNQMPCFLLGLCYYFFSDQKLFRPLVFLLVGPAVWLLSHSFDRPWGWMTGPTAAGIVALALALGLERVTSPAILRRIGEVSFSMYILHFVVIALTGPTFGRLIPVAARNEATTVVLYLLICALSFGVALICNRGIELPFIALGRKYSARLQSARLPA